METNKYKPIEGVVRVGQGYSTDRDIQDIAYCFEATGNSEECHSASRYLEDMITQLRMFRVEPYQVDNAGTDTPFKTKELPDRQFERVIKGISKPIIIITKLPREKRFRRKINEDGLDTNRQFLIELYKKRDICKLNDVPVILNMLGVRPVDLIFLKKKLDGYAPMEKNYKYYILSLLDRVR